MKKEIWRAGNMLYPLPVVMVSCARSGEKPNIITLAWAGTVCTNPPMVSISVRPERYSHDIIDKTGEFVINLVTKDLVHACDWCGVRSGREHDKFAVCGLDAEKAREMSFAPLIRQSPVNLECRVTQKIPLGSHDLFLARVVCVHVDGNGLDENGRYDLGRAGLVSYSHGEYFALGEKLGSFGYSVKKASAVAGKKADAAGGRKAGASAGKKTDAAGGRKAGASAGKKADAAGGRKAGASAGKSMGTASGENGDHTGGRKGNRSKRRGI